MPIPSGDERPPLLDGLPEIPIEGTCSPRFDIVRERFEQYLREGIDVGASVAVTIGGEMVVDLWGGHIDEARSGRWERDTIVNTFSTTKTMTSLCGLILCDAGTLDLDAPVERYWPEFGANGKGSVLVRHLLAHASGLAGWEEPMSMEDLYDWDKATGLLARQAPWWVPGTASGYHAITYGYLIGELVRRVTGQTLDRFFREQVAGPTGADFQIAVEAADDHRVARPIPPAGRPTSVKRDMSSTPAKVLSNPGLNIEETWTERWRRAGFGGMGGAGNARSVALAQSLLANDGMAKGKRVLSERSCLWPLAEQTYGTDHVLQRPTRMGLGYALPSGIVPLVGRSCGWGGLGGSMVVVDFDRQMTFAYVMNKMYHTPTPLSGPFSDPRSQGLLLATYAAIAAPCRAASHPRPDGRAAGENPEDRWLSTSTGG